VAFEIIMPRLSDSMEEATIVHWLVAEGDSVEPGQPLVEIETDKATVTYEADAAGVVLALSVGEGANVAVGTPIALLGDTGEELPAARSRGELVSAGSLTATAGAGREGTSAQGPPDHRASASPTPASSPVSGAARPKASPLARRLAAALDVDLAALSGSGPNGRVIGADVERARVEARPRAAQSTEPASSTRALAASPAAKGEATSLELSHLQSVVARRMADSRATVPDFELRCEVDMSAAVELRERLREVADPAPSYNDFVVKAAALALREFPRVNASYRDGLVETYPRINVGVAVAADDALLVPTIFAADRISLGEIARTTRSLASRVRDGKISPAEMDGGTFTVSNLGMYGVDSFSAVINPPQAAILAVGSLKPRAIVLDDGQLAARPTILLSLACDHRVLYGADGARFLARVRDLLERPDALVL
jgi:pyruvate dehydrogenase E2 component (dihydrolipoamide acetyltransferase)